MTVKDLIQILSKENPECLVVCQKDAEGNNFSPLSSAWSGAYVSVTTWYGEAGLSEITDELRALGYSDEDVRTTGVPALMLVPIN